MVSERIIKPAAKRCIGNTYGKLTVLSVSWDKGKGTTLGNYVLCECKCGKEKVVRADSLERGDTTSCGCNYSTPAGRKFKTDKTSDHPLYSVFRKIQDRCKNTNSTDYKYYGGRGIHVCDRWNTSKTKKAFHNFIDDMENSYEVGLEIERLDVNGDYSPDNCTWVCRKSQVNNLRRNRKLKGFGIELNVTEWGHLLNFNCKMLDGRINKLKWDDDLEKLLNSTFRDRRHHILFRGEVLTAGEVWSKLGYTQGQIKNRLNKYGDSISALSAEGVVFEVVKKREKDIYTFEEGLEVLESKQNRTPFEDHLLFKIKDQLKEK